MNTIYCYCLTQQNECIQCANCKQKTHLNCYYKKENENDFLCFVCKIQKRIPNLIIRNFLQIKNFTLKELQQKQNIKISLLSLKSDAFFAIEFNNYSQQSKSHDVLDESLLIGEKKIQKSSGLWILNQNEIKNMNQKNLIYKYPQEQIQIDEAQKIEPKIIIMLIEGDLLTKDEFFNFYLDKYFTKNLKFANTLKECELAALHKKGCVFVIKNQVCQKYGDLKQLIDNEFYCLECEERHFTFIDQILLCSVTSKKLNQYKIQLEQQQKIQNKPQERVQSVQKKHRKENRSKNRSKRYYSKPRRVNFQMDIVYNDNLIVMESSDTESQKQKLFQSQRKIYSTSQNLKQKIIPMSIRNLNFQSTASLFQQANDKNYKIFIKLTKQEEQFINYVQKLQQYIEKQICIDLEVFFEPFGYRYKKHYQKLDRILEYKDYDNLAKEMKYMNDIKKMFLIFNLFQSKYKKQTNPFLWIRQAFSFLLFINLRILEFKSKNQESSQNLLQKSEQTLVLQIRCFQTLLVNYCCDQNDNELLTFGLIESTVGIIINMVRPQIYDNLNNISELQFDINEIQKYIKQIRLLTEDMLQNYFKEDYLKELLEKVYKEVYHELKI